MSLKDLLPIDRPLIGLDLETTSNIKQQARIVEIGFIELKPDGREREWASLVNPGVPIPSEASAVHHITDIDVMQKPTFGQLAKDLARGFEGVDFYGYNIRFDLDVLVEEFKRVGIRWSYESARVLDGLRLWQIGAPRTLTDAVQEFCGHPHDDAHGALPDVRAARDVIVAELQRWPEQLPREIGRLHVLQFPKVPGAIDAAGRFVWNEHGEAVINFGKYRGHNIRNIDKGFLKWMLGQDFSDEVKAIVREALAGRYPTKEAA